MKKYRILTPARQELINSIEYYNSKKEGLGYTLLLNFEEAIDRVRDNPKAWPLVSKNTRRCLLKNFPYGIIYHINDCMEIIAFMNLRKKPGYWANRL